MRTAAAAAAADAAGTSSMSHDVPTMMTTTATAAAKATTMPTLAPVATAADAAADCHSTYTETLNHHHPPPALHDQKNRQTGLKWGLFNFACLDERRSCLKHASCHDNTRFDFKRVEATLVLPKCSGEPVIKARYCLCLTGCSCHASAKDSKESSRAWQLQVEFESFTRPRWSTGYREPTFGLGSRPARLARFDAVWTPSKQTATYSEQVSQFVRQPLQHRLSPCHMPWTRCLETGFDSS